MPSAAVGRVEEAVDGDADGETANKGGRNCGRRGERKERARVDVSLITVALAYTLVEGIKNEQNVRLRRRDPVSGRP